MKILESTYFRPRKILTETYFNNQYQIEMRELDQQTRVYDEPYEELIRSLMPVVNLRGDDVVIKKEKLADFILCTDYNTVCFDPKMGKFYNREICYFIPEYEVFLIASEDIRHDYQKKIADNGFLYVQLLGYDSRTPNNQTRLQEFYDKYLEKYVNDEGKISLLLKEGQDLVFKTHTIKPLSLDIHTMYNDDFLPVHHKIKDELTQNSKGLVLLHGVAGSGKTNYIKWLTAQIPDKNFIFVPNNLIGALAEPQFMSMLIDEKNSILVLEDCENYIAERAGGGNTSDVVSTILNIADGILSDVLECQFICTFNADLTDIDHALLRHGRLIAEYQFGALSVEKANQYLKSVGKEMQVDKPKTLAEITHIDETHFKAEEKKSGFGFV